MAVQYSDIQQKHEIRGNEVLRFLVLVLLFPFNVIFGLPKRLVNLVRLVLKMFNAIFGLPKRVSWHLISGEKPVYKVVSGLLVGKVRRENFQFRKAIVCVSETLVYRLLSGFRFFIGNQSGLRQVAMQVVSKSSKTYKTYKSSKSFTPCSISARSKALRLPIKIDIDGFQDGIVKSGLRPFRVVAGFKLTTGKVDSLPGKVLEY